MKLINSIQQLDPIQNYAITFGNFDGVHTGHRELLKKIKLKSSNAGLKLIATTFIPHPHKILFPERKNYLINSYDERRELLSNLGIEILLELSFNRDFSTLKPGDFLDNYIFGNNRIKKIFLGYDFAFGANKEGDFNFIQNYCKNKKIEVEINDEFEYEGKSVSSTAIRDLISKGDVESAAQLLNRTYFVSGLVKVGERRGRDIGFPTANLSLDEDRIYPAVGVYITKTLINGMPYCSVTNIGFKPTFEGKRDLSLETHILDFNKDIYGENLQIQFIKRLRNEKKFESVNTLVEQIRFDVEEAKKYFDL